MSFLFSYSLFPLELIQLNTFVFHNGWGNYTIISAGTIDEDVLDFSAVSVNLTFTLYKDGRVSVTDGLWSTLGASAGIESIIGGSGINTFVFEDQGGLEGYIGEAEQAGTNILDYSAYTTAISLDLCRSMPGGATALLPIYARAGHTATLLPNNTYYVSVKATNGLGTPSAVGTSDGITVAVAATIGAALRTGKLVIAGGPAMHEPATARQKKTRVTAWAVFISG
jgi:hypothetical protein